MTAENPLKRLRVEDSPSLNTSTLSLSGQRALSGPNVSTTASFRPNPPNQLEWNRPGPSHQASSQELLPTRGQPQSHQPPDQEPATGGQAQTQREHPALNPDAPPFTFTATGTANTTNTRRKKTKAPTISPENAKIDYLNLELNAAKTRIVQLETTNNDFAGTIKYRERK